MSRNYPNMSYCAFENTADAMRQVLAMIYNAQGSGQTYREFIDGLSDSEQRGFERVNSMLGEMAEVLDEWSAADNYDDSMDGDDASALASAGFGTDEDYG